MDWREQCCMTSMTHSASHLRCLRESIPSSCDAEAGSQGFDTLLVKKRDNRSGLVAQQALARRIEPAVVLGAAFCLSGDTDRWPQHQGGAQAASFLAG